MGGPSHVVPVHKLRHTLFCMLGVRYVGGNHRAMRTSLLSDCWYLKRAMLHQLVEISITTRTLAHHGCHGMGVGWDVEGSHVEEA